MDEQPVSASVSLAKQAGSEHLEEVLPNRRGDPRTSWRSSPPAGTMMFRAGTSCSLDGAPNLAFPHSVSLNRGHRGRDQGIGIAHPGALAGGATPSSAGPCLFSSPHRAPPREVAIGPVQPPEQGGSVGGDMPGPPLRTIHDPVGEAIRSGGGMADPAAVVHPLRTGTHHFGRRGGTGPIAVDPDAGGTASSGVSAESAGMDGNDGKVDPSG